MTLVRMIRIAERTKQERDEMEHALREIERVRIMDGVSAIRMRAIARTALAVVKEDA